MNLNSSELKINLNLKEALAGRSKLFYPSGDRRPSAVLIPLFYRQEQYQILFTRRSQLVRHHKGEISFPGGGYGQDDGTLLNTALRESFEEIGLDPGDVEILGELDDVPTRHSNYVITPFVGFISPRNKYVLSDFEIEELIEIPIDGLLAEGCFREVPRNDPDDELNIPYVYAYEGKVITGATARILKQFLGIYLDIRNKIEK